ncbi:MAG: iron-containing alcohol dehydrogenase [Clostridiaceae bacterium]|mgnify:CR=1 FL=1|jgi:alcohol dehydrogenase YqhD (iron-dependent ADH family)|nr:iron-containing alcohol dehydrogenase [Clostridiaceae bacterium]
MNSFTFYSPTKVIFGKDAELHAAREIREFGGTKVMVIYGGGSVVKSGLLDRITRQLEDEGISYITLGGVKPNPVLSFAREGTKKAIEDGIDFILAVGGGSVIDTAKAIAHGTANPDIDIWSFWTGEAALEKSLPVGVVLTLSAAGSEMSNSAVITNEEIKSKRGLSTDFNRPRFALMNPELTYTLPKYQIMCGIVDIMMHTLDRFFTSVLGNEFTDEIAAALLRVMIRNGPVALENPRDYHAMSEIMWCGSLSHNGLTGLGGAQDFATHQLGHELSAMFDVAHGASLSTMWGSWAKYCFSQNPERFAQFGRMVWGITGDNAEEVGMAAIDRTVEFFASVGAPTCFSELGIGVQPESVINELSDRCVRFGERTIGNFRVLDRYDAYKIYTMANR